VTDHTSSVRGIAPLYLAGLTTAVGAHGVASVLGSETDDIGMSLLGLGVVLALYDLAEVVLKPIFGALSDRIGTKPVIVGGLLAFVVASAIAFLAPTPLVIALARLGQGAAASAFSPAASASVARLAGKQRLGRYFGRYGAWKSLGYVLGPLAGILLTQAFGIEAVYALLAVLAALAAVWVIVSLPAIAPLPKRRTTLADLVRQTTERGFLIPTLVLATSTGVLGVAVGFLPLLATRLGLPAVVGAIAVGILALASTLLQPVVGRLRDRGRISTRVGSGAGLAVAALGLALLAIAPNAVSLFAAALAFGVMTGTVTPLAFAHLADSTPEQHLGRTMGNAELGRELGDAGGPLLVGAVATAWALPAALGVLAGATLASAAVGWGALRPARAEDGSA